VADFNAPNDKVGAFAAIPIGKSPEENISESVLGIVAILFPTFDNKAF
jgi:hypothetical protein